jgi:hypothetical protein
MPEFGVLCYPDFVLSHGTTSGHAAAVASASASSERVPQ